MEDRYKVRAAIAAIRDIVNTPRRQYAIMQNLRGWFQVAAVLDTLEDADLALEAFGICRPEHDGERYLALYGALQAMFLQQDAVLHLGEAVGVSVAPIAGLEEIRSIRNDVVGHPTKRGPKHSFTTHTVVRWSLSMERMTVFSSNAAGTALVERNIDLARMNETQRNGIGEQLNSIVNELVRQEKTHMESHSANPLVALFPQTITYVVSKISEGIRAPGSEKLALGHLEYLEQVVGRFRGALVERGELPANEMLGLDIAQIDYPIARLKSYLSGENRVGFADQDAMVFLYYVDKQLEALRRLAQEIDGGYKNEA